jgi:hypothetical protein
MDFPPLFISALSTRGEGIVLKIYLFRMSDTAMDIKQSSSSVLFFYEYLRLG